MGLTPASWQLTYVEDNPRRNKFVAMQKACMDWFEKECGALGTVHALVFVGDGIDGRGEKTGGTEQITTNRSHQVQMCAEWMDSLKAQDIYMVRGTGYHTGDYEDFEDAVAKEVNARKIEDHGWLNIRGHVVDYKHHLSGTGMVPHTVATAPLRDALWNSLWAERREQPKSDILIRAHTHTFVEARTTQWHAIVLPALQNMGSKFGARRCSKTVDFGFIHIDFFSPQRYEVCYHFARFPALMPKAITMEKYEE